MLDQPRLDADNEFPAWPYRDYVLNAFRDNKPFDDFTREQLAGDLIPNATLEQRTASAYNRIHRVSSEGGIQDKEYLAKYGADRVRTTSAVWLGITTGCAECHDHKFDPILTKDFYSMKAVFADLEENGIVGTSGPKGHGTKMMLPSNEQRELEQQLSTELAGAKSALAEKVKAAEARRMEWEKEILAAHEAGNLAWHYQRPLSAATKNGAKLTIYNEEPVDSNFYLFDFFGTFSASLVTERRRGDGLIVASGPGEGVWTALGVDVMQDEGLPGARVSRGADRFVLTEVEAELSSGGGESPRDVSFVLATASSLFAEQPEHRAMGAIDGDSKTGWGVSRGEGVNPFLALRFSEKLKTSADSVVTIRLQHDSSYRSATIGRFRVALSSGTYSAPEIGLAFDKVGQRPPDSDEGTLIQAVERGLPGKVLGALKIDEAERKEEQQKAVTDHFAWSEPEFEGLVARVADLEAKLGALKEAIPMVVVSRTTEPRKTRILPRGNWMDDSGEIVEPAIPVFLGKLDTNGQRASRLDFANWIGRHRGAQNAAPGRALAASRMETLPPLRRGRGMRIPLPTARLGAGLPFPGAALRKRAQGRRGRAIPVVRHQRLHLPRVCHQSGRADRGGGVVLQSARRSREPDQGGQQRRRAGGPSLAPL